MCLMSVPNPVRDPAHSLDFGWLTGFEPATAATTTRCSTYLSYSHHEAALTIGVWSALGDAKRVEYFGFMPRRLRRCSRACQEST